MKAKRAIEITVAPSGELTVEALGYVGSSCEKATAFLELALGNPTKLQRKPEYYRLAQTKKVLRVES